MSLPVLEYGEVQVLFQAPKGGWEEKLCRKWSRCCLKMFVDGCGEGC